MPQLLWSQVVQTLPDPHFVVGTFQPLIQLGQGFGAGDLLADVGQQRQLFLANPRLLCSLSQVLVGFAQGLHHG